MSAKLLYTLSDDNPNLQKQIGCMNGFLQFFDRRHYISSRSINRRLPPAEGSGQQRDGNATGKRSKEKHHKVAKEMQRNVVEPSRTSFSSSTGSTTMSSLEYDSTIKSEQSPFHETISTETNSWDFKVNQPRFPTCKWNSSPIRTPKRGPVINQVDSPRFEHPSKLDSPRLTGLNESISSNYSAPITPMTKKNASRMSYDGTETREKFVTSLKFGDLPRLSLDSRQQTINKSISESRKDLLLSDLQKKRQPSSNIQNLPEEPGSYRPPSNIVVKLMGLEALPDYTPTHKNQTDPDGFSIYGGLNSLSRSSRTIDESKVNQVLESPRNNSKESRTPRLSKESSTRVWIEPTPRKNQDRYTDSGKTAAKHQEVQPKSLNHPLTLYGEIERKWADLDFKKSGKDLRALKQILEAMHREKTMKEAKKENWSSGCSAEMSISSHIGQTKGPQKANQQHENRTCQIPHRGKVSRNPQDIKSTKAIKPAKVVRDSEKASASIVHNVPLPRLHQQRFNKPVPNVLDSIDKKATEIYCSQEPASQTQSITGRDFRARTPRPIRTSKATEHVTKGNVTCLVKISETVPKMYTRNHMAENHSHTTVTTLISRTKQNQQNVGPHLQNQKLRRKSPILQDSNDDSSELSADVACLSQQRNSSFLLSESNSGSVCQADSKSPQRTRGDESLAEQPIDMKEQPSPVSVLDAKFYGDESPSPVKKKLTAFTADDDTTSTTTENEWKDIDINYSTFHMRQSFSCDSDHQRQEKIKRSGQTLRQLNFYQGGNVTSTTLPHKDANLETEYVRDILLASGFLDDHYFIDVNHRVYQCKGTLNPNLFLVLEQTRGNRFLSDDDIEANTMKKTYDKHRRLVFDVVNELLSNKLPSKGMEHQPQLFQNRLSGFKSGHQLLQEILKEVDRLQANNFHQSVDDEDKFLTSIIEKDLMHRSANWIHANSEISGLVLDIERLIYKDLIVELVHDEAAHLQAQIHERGNSLPH